MSVAFTLQGLLLSISCTYTHMHTQCTRMTRLPPQSTHMAALHTHSSHTRVLLLSHGKEITSLPLRESLEQVTQWHCGGTLGSFEDTERSGVGLRSASPPSADPPH